MRPITSEEAQDYLAVLIEMLSPGRGSVILRGSKPTRMAEEEPGPWPRNAEVAGGGRTSEGSNASIAS
jgi:hypothetical protein